MMKTRTSPQGTRLQGRRLILARALFWGLTGLMIVLAFAGYTLYIVRDGREVCSGTVSECTTRLQYNPAQVADFERRGVAFQTMLVLRITLLMVGNLASLGIGLLIAIRRPDDWMALLMALFLIINGTVANGGVLSALTRAVPILSIPVAVFLLLFSNLLVLGFGLFPNGRVAPHGMSRFLPFLCILISLVTILPQNSLAWIWPFVAILMFISFSMLLSAQVIRYFRYSTLVERQQTKWAVTGITCYLLVLMMTALFAELKPFGENLLLNSVIGSLGFNLLPSLLIAVFFGVAILRSNLWDIDVIIRKTLIYTTITGFLALAYSVAILLLQSLFDRLGAGQSQVAIVLSTLAIVVLFNPVRRRVQAGVDRRFYRKKYDAEQVLAEFATTARDEVDVERLSAALVAAVEGTVQPKTISLWIKTQPANMPEPSEG